MDVECVNEYGTGIAFTTKTSTISEEITYPEPPKLQNFDSFFEKQPSLFKGTSELNNEPKNDLFMDLFGEEQVFKKNQINE